MKATIEIRPLQKSDADSLAAGFAQMGWTKPMSQYIRYLDEQAKVVISTQSPGCAGCTSWLRWGFLPLEP